MDVVTCHCGKRCVLKTSWTDHNPGRRFLGCSQYGVGLVNSIIYSLSFFMILYLSVALILQSVGACGFFVWVDPPLCSRARQIIPGLLRRTNELQGKLQVHRRREKWFIVCVVISWIFSWWWKVRLDFGGGNGNCNVNEKGDGMYMQLG